LEGIFKIALPKAIFEEGEAIAAFATYREAEGVQHQIAALAYSAAAAATGIGLSAITAGGGGSGPAGGNVTRTTAATSGPGSQYGGRGNGETTINLNFGGTVLATKEGVARTVASALNASTRMGIAPRDFVAYTRTGMN
jgi:hypothetical protein